MNWGKFESTPACEGCECECVGQLSSNLTDNAYCEDGGGLGGWVDNDAGGGGVLEMERPAFTQFHRQCSLCRLIALSWWE